MKQDIINFLLKVNEENPFIPKTLDYQTYINKLFTQAVILPFIDEGEIMGVAAIYCNDRINKRAFFSLLAISKNQKRKSGGSNRGLGIHLTKMALLFMELNDFETVGCEVYKNNTHSLKLCERVGFVIKEDKGEFYVLEKVFNN